MKILDTNFICSLFNQTDQNHDKAKDIFFEIDEDEKLLIPFIVAAELAISNDARKLLSASKKITPRFLASNEDDLNYVAKLPDRLRRKLKANDCLIIALCKRKKAELLTFDKSLSSALHSL